MWVVILFTLVLTYLIYYCCFKPYNYWKYRGITYEIPLPVVGNFGDTVFKRRHASEVYDYLYKKYANKRYVGIYIFMKPALLVRDLGLIKKICLEEFDHFTERVKIFDKNFDAVVGNSLLSLKGKEWKEARTSLDRIFGVTQIESIFRSISDCADIFSNYFVREGEDLLEVRLNDVFSRYESDVISRICLGIVSNSLKDRDNDCFKAYKRLKSFGALERIKLSLIQLCPVLAKILHMKVFATSKTNFYKKIVVKALHNSNVEDKKDNNFLSYVLDANVKPDKGKTKKERAVAFVDDESESGDVGEHIKKEWTEDELTAQVVMFLNSHTGIEAFLSTSSFLAYELALNPSIQVKLQEEIDNVQSTENPITYESICRMKYLHCVVLESLRKWPPVYQTDRECVKNFFEVDLAIPDDEKIVIEKDTAVIVPVMAIHRDANYFPHPDKFNPERFSDEHRNGILPGSYMPFGRGPRKCIGYKLALLEIKLLFFHLLSKFDLVPTENTKTRVEINPNRFDVNGATNTFLGFKPRKVTSL